MIYFLIEKTLVLKILHCSSVKPASKTQIETFSLSLYLFIESKFKYLRTEYMKIDGREIEFVTCNICGEDNTTIIWEKNKF